MRYRPWAWARAWALLALVACAGRPDGDRRGPSTVVSGLLPQPPAEAVRDAEVHLLCIPFASTPELRDRALERIGTLVLRQPDELGGPGVGQRPQRDATDHPGLDDEVDGPGRHERDPRDLVQSERVREAESACRLHQLEEWSRSGIRVTWMRAHHS